MNRNLLLVIDPEMWCARARRGSRFSRIFPDLPPPSRSILDPLRFMISLAQFEREIGDFLMNPFVAKFRGRPVDVSSICLIDGKFPDMPAFLFIRLEKTGSSFAMEYHS